MTRTRDAGSVLLLEIGTEEIPARMVEGGRRDLADGLLRMLEGERLVPESGFSRRESVRTFGTPRRLAAIVKGLRERQPDETIEVLGPPVSAAFDSRGRPTRAAEGFARAQGVAPSDLVRASTPRGECVAARRTVRGLAVAEVLARKIPEVVSALTFPKMMRWGAGEHLFVRPIHSVVALLDDRVVEMTIAGVRSGRTTFGHRLARRDPIPLQHPGEYLPALREGLVIADVEERRGMIAAQLEDAARAADGRIASPPGSAGRPEEGDPELLEEVTHLVEWPLVVAGDFDAAFLDLPSEILVTAMRHHQKYFSLRAPSGELRNMFLAVVNCREDRSGAIRRGNEWVLRARLADARFFWEEDRKAPLRDHAAALERLTFHERLGSYTRKTARIAALSEAILPAFREAGAAPDAAATREAARLCKADLTTQMVKEFPELEGIVGGLYARADGEARAVWEAIYGHDLPRGADDPLPPTPEGAIVSLADRVDTQAGIFLLGILPTGSRDPYGLRRSVHGVCRVLIESRVSLSLPAMLDLALEGYGDPPIEGAVPREQAKKTLLEFYRGRLQHLGEEASLRHDSVRAALATDPGDPYDAHLRMTALEAIRSDPGFRVLATAHKRIKNILRDQGRCGFDPRRLRDDAERSLHRQLEAALPPIEAAGRRRDYLAALREIARLGPGLDRFFTEVMVMAEEAALRENRLALLESIASLFLRVGDFSEIVLEGEPAGAAVRRTS